MNRSINRSLRRPFLLLLVALWAVGLAQLSAGESRTILNLDGDWQIAEGGMEAPPTRFAQTVPVPGLVDQAQPAFAEVGEKSALREAFWYRRRFAVTGNIPDVATLKVHKAMFGMRVFVNGKLLGDQLHSFTPGYFDAKAALRSGDNEILVRIGASRDVVPKPIPTGADGEKIRYIPGIYDSVELIPSGSPRILRVQAVPDINTKSATIHAWIRQGEKPAAAKLSFIVREAVSGKTVGESTCTIPATGEGPERTGQVTLAIAGCRLWSPEDPFLYEIEVRSDADELKTRFGMRSFTFDQPSGRALLNGKPYFMRGSNVTLYRFFEDPERGDKPWREEWVRRMHKTFRGMHWNSLRYCIGFPPEFWYRIADEEGFLIQDEFPIWSMDPKPGDFDPDELAQEYTEWMQERWNHPSVVIWDACNETHAGARTGEAIQKVRGLDFSKRPWDNGWAPPQAPGDVFESHPYHFHDAHYKLANLADESGIPRGNVGIANSTKNPIIINEYGWLWLNRDGTPTTLTRELYKNLLGPDSTPAQRLHTYARYTAAETEFWRSHRACAGVLHFCGLGYSRSDGQTSDHWADIEKLTWEPEFYKYVRDAFAPVGLMIDAWAEEYVISTAQAFPVVVINDLDTAWEGTLRFRLLGNGATVQEKTLPCTVPPLGSTTLTFTVNMPAEEGTFQVEAALVKPRSETVCSLRDFTLINEEQRRARFGLALGKNVTASSSRNASGALTPKAVCDGKLSTRWSSDFSDAQWLAVDLGKSETVSRVVLDWDPAFAKVYALDASIDGQTWKEIHHTQNGRGGSEEIRFTPVEARWIRLRGIQRATAYGYSLWEFRVFR